MQHRKHLRFALAGAALLCLSRPGAAGDAPANAQRPPTVVSTPQDSVDDGGQGPAVLEQWHGDGSTRGSVDQVLKRLEGDKRNAVTRVSTCYPNGVTHTSETSVTSGLPGKRLLYDGRREWGQDGTLQSAFRQVDTLNDAGVQVKGVRSTQSFAAGRLSGEQREVWDPDFRGWLVSYSSVLAYYPNGDLQRREVRVPPANLRTREDWGPLLAHGRAKKTLHWDSATDAWAGK